MLEECIDVLKRGKRVIYIAPSRELIEHVRQKIAERFGGLINIDVIVIDEMEKNCAREFMGKRRLLPEDIGIMVLKQVMGKLAHREEINFYLKVYTRYGFLHSMVKAIKRIRRQYISPGEFLKKAREAGDEILVKKAEEIAVIYDAYSEKLRELGFLDLEDLALVAMENADKSSYLDDVELIVIDGYINLDRIDRQLLKSIKQKRSLLRIMGHVPMNTPFIDRFIKDEIYKDFEEMGAEVVKKDFAEDGIFKELASCLFTGNRLSVLSSDIKVLNAPCLEDEVRQAAKIIKSILFENKTIPEKIAVITADMESYGDCISEVFEEMNLPTNQGRYLKLSKVPVIRDLFISFSTAEGDVQKVSDHAAKLMEMADKLNIKQKLNELYKNKTISSYIFIRDLKAYISFMEILNDIKREYTEFDDKIPFRDFLDLIKRRIEEATISVRGRNPAGIKILDPDLLKGTVYDYVFFLGLNEGIFPRIPAKGGIFTPHERELLFKLGVNLESPGWELSREKIRFILSVASAQKGLYLSYRNTDEDGGYLIKSPFLEELIFAANLDRDSTSIAGPRNMRQRFALKAGDVWSLKEAVEMAVLERYVPLNANDSRQPAHGLIYEALKGRAGWLSAVDMAHGIEEKRNSPEPSNYNGRVGPGRVFRFNENYYFSPSQLNSFNLCPFRYFVERVLGVTVEDDEETAFARDKGNLYHTVLRKYYEGCENALEFDEQRLIRKAAEAFADAGLGDDDIAAITYKKEIMDVLKNFLTRDASYLSEYFRQTGRLLKPYYLEKAFLDESIFSGFKICARVDRVDLEYDGGRPTGRFVIYDYKSKASRNLRKCLEDKDFQLIVYYHLAKKELSKELNMAPECIALLYYDIENAKSEGIIVEEEKRRLGKKGNIDTISRSNFEIVMEHFKNLAVHMLREIREGNFMLPKRCFFTNAFTTYSCKYRSVCRFNEE